MWDVVMSKIEEDHSSIVSRNPSHALPRTHKSSSTISSSSMNLLKSTSGLLGQNALKTVELFGSVSFRFKTQRSFVAHSAAMPEDVELATVRCAGVLKPDPGWMR